MYSFALLEKLPNSQLHAANEASAINPPRIKTDKKASFLIKSSLRVHRQENGPFF